MKNLLNCHSVGTHSFPISFEGNLYKRVFYAEATHNLWKVNPLEIAIHPHHVDIKITVLDGELYNCLYGKSNHGKWWNRFIWDSVILNGTGGFKKDGHEKLKLISKTGYKKGESFVMKACELHTVFVKKNKKAVWFIEEEVPTCEYFPVNYSNTDLTKWSSAGLYQEVDDRIKMNFIKDYLPLIT